MELPTDIEKSARKLKTVGLVTAGLSLMGAVWPIVAVVFFRLLIEEKGASSSSVPLPFLGNFGHAFRIVCTAQTFLCTLSLIGGLLFYSLRQLGRILILIVMWAYFLYCVGFTVFIETIMIRVLASNLHLLPFVVFAPLNGLLWCTILGLGIRYFSKKAKADIAVVTTAVQQHHT